MKVNANSKGNWKFDLQNNCKDKFNFLRKKYIFWLFFKHSSRKTVDSSVRSELSKSHRLVGENMTKHLKIFAILNLFIFFSIVQILSEEIDQGTTHDKTFQTRNNKLPARTCDFNDPHSPLRIRQPDNLATPEKIESVSSESILLRNKVFPKGTNDSDNLINKPVPPPRSPADLFFDAIKAGNISAVTTLLETKVSPNIENKYGRAPLFCAIKEKNSQIVDLLFNHGAKVEILDHGSTPLETAVRLNNTPIVKSLLVRGGLTKVHPSVLEKSKTSEENWETRKQNLLCVAIAQGNCELFDLLISYGVTVDRNPRSSFKTELCPLHLAAKKNNVQIIQKLLSLGIPVNQSSCWRDFPLHVAAENGAQEAALCLLKNGADPNIKNSSGDIPAYSAIKHDHPELAEILFQNIYLDNKEIFEKTRVTDGEKYLALFLKLGADPDISDEDGIPLLHEAVARRTLGSVKLLASYGADINVIGRDGNTPLHTLIYEIYPWGGNRYEIHLNILKFLLEQGAKPDVCNVNGNTPLHLCFCRTEGRPSEVIKALLEKNADVNAINYDHDTPLLLAERGICSLENVNLYDAERVFVGTKRLDIRNAGVKLLLENGAKVNIVDKMGNTPLHLAVMTNHFQGVKALLENGAEISAKNNNNETPLDIALQPKYHGSKDIVTLLKNKDTSFRITLDFETENMLILAVFFVLAAIFYSKGLFGNAMSILSIGLMCYGFRDFCYSPGYSDPFFRIMAILIMPKTLIPILFSMLLSIGGLIKKRGFLGWFGVILFFSLTFTTFILPYVLFVIAALMGARIHQ